MMATTIHNLPSALISEITGYLRPEETSFVSKRLHEASLRFQQSYVNQLPSSNPIKRIWKHQPSDSFQERISKTAEAAHKLFIKSNTLLTDEEWRNNHVDLASPTEKTDLREMSRRADLIANKRAKILIDFFDRLADVVPEAREFLYGLPISLREKAQAIRQWMKDPVNQPFLAQVTHLAIFKDPAMTFEEFIARGDDIDATANVEDSEKICLIFDLISDCPPEAALITNLDADLFKHLVMVSCYKLHIEAFDELTSLPLILGTNYFFWAYSQFLKKAAQKGRLDLVKWILSKALDFANEDMNHALALTPEKYKVELVRTFIREDLLFRIQIAMEMDLVLSKAVEMEDNELFKFLVDHEWGEGVISLPQALKAASQKEDSKWFDTIVLNWGGQINYIDSFQKSSLDTVRKILSRLLLSDNRAFYVDAARAVSEAERAGYFPLVQEILSSHPQRLKSLVGLSRTSRQSCCDKVMRLMRSFCSQLTNRF